jgi:hypothetical protein
VFEDVDVGDSVSLHTRWKRHDGAGRGDLRYVDLIGAQLEERVLERRARHNPVGGGDDTSAPDASGAEGNCDFIPAAYATLTIPTAP